MKLFLSGSNVQDFCEGSNPKEVLGGKGAGLAEMSHMGISVPPFAVIPTSECMRHLSEGIAPSEFDDLIDQVETHFKAQFGCMPLVSVRSGARVSMPGMMDTILNVGIDGMTAGFWKDTLPHNCYFDSYERYLEMFGSVVLAIPRQELTEAKGTTAKLAVWDAHGFKPMDSRMQIQMAVEAVFESWNNPRAKFYREMHGIPEEWGTAVTIQAMVFGNMNPSSCTGVLFTRNPSTGEPGVTGEFLEEAQGEDVVAGIRTPKSLNQMAEWNSGLYQDLITQVTGLENHYTDMQDVEFTVQNGMLFILQTRTGKRTAQAAIKIAHDLVKEGAISVETALGRITYSQFLLASKPTIDPSFSVPATGKGLPASSGVVSGVVVFTAGEAVASKVPCILLSHETTPDDIAGMKAAVGVLTQTGGATSHAAVVARGMDRTCVVGCTDLVPSEASQCWTLNGVGIHPGTLVTLNGDTGEIWVNIEVPLVDPDQNESLSWLKEQLMSNTLPLVSEATEASEGWVTTYHLDTAPVKVVSLARSMKAGYLDLRGLSRHPESHFVEVADTFGGVVPFSVPEELRKAKALAESATKLSKSKVVYVVSDPEASATLKGAGLTTLCLLDFMDSVLFSQHVVLYQNNESKKLSDRVTRILELRALAGETVDTLSVGDINPYASKNYMSVQSMARARLA